MFRDRQDAAGQLAERLQTYRGCRDAIVLAIPRGGVVIGDLVARQLGLELDVVLAKKIGHPNSPEYAIGVVNLTKESIDEDVVAGDSIAQSYIDEEILRIRRMLQKRYKLYRGTLRPKPLKGKTAIIVDDGAATGNTMMAALRLARSEQAAKVVAALPVAPPHTAAEFRELADEVVCLMESEDFMAIGEFYGDFEQVSDDDVVRLLKSR